ncbi:MAG: hypothetical protein ABFD60_16620 [Bryobacteraceae bacterium]
MFDSLDDQMKHDAEQERTKSGRWLLALTVVVISVLVFGGLYFGIRMLE